LFGRYSTYCGSSPFATPATLMLVAHVEAQGVWLIDGGMSALAGALQRLAQMHGAKFLLNTPVARIDTRKGRASGVILENGIRLAADSVVVNADPSALAAGDLGPDVTHATRRVKPRSRSLSAMVWLAHAQTAGFPLSRHNVFFSHDYAREFADITGGGTPSDPSVYVCAQDRGAATDTPLSGRERLQVIVNASANGDRHIYSNEEKERCTEAMMRSLKRCGLEMEQGSPMSLVTPNDFEALFPSTGGALYGRASHGWAASFLRQGTRTRIPGLYCAGGATHPGAGVPMAALSGQLAARETMRDLASMRRFHPVAMPGGTSMRSVRTGGMG
jgi:1-hydroxycarotenoid 3,4-desaturase